MAKIMIVIEDIGTGTATIDARVMRFAKPSETDFDTQACRLGNLLEAVLQHQLSNHGMGVTQIPSSARH